MAARNPRDQLATHRVENQPPPLEGYNAFESDPVLVAGIEREGAGWAAPRCQKLGALVGSEHVIRLGFEANRFPPELVTHDRFGRRIDEVEFHPAYHELMRLMIEQRVPTIAWMSQSGGHVAHAALLYLFVQVEAGVACPTTMTYAAIPALRRQPELALEWEPRILAERYDPRSIPAVEKEGVTFGMAMTEKQGGSDVRANTTRARPLAAPGAGAEYELSGHKWFCSAPMSDAFLMLAYTDSGGMGCFLVPRWKPDGTRNGLFFQRLKHKLGNRSNASGELELDRAWGRMLGGEGRGIATILEMVHHTRLDTVCAAAGLMRQAVVQATWHCTHRSAFGKRLAEQALMRNVLADLSLEAEAAGVLALRIARGFDESQGDPVLRVLTRLMTAVGKYWTNKRTPGLVAEALECLGGAGYVEESVLPRLYREAPLNGIWEGSGNVICLDVLRSMQREPASVQLFIEELALARGGNAHLDAAVNGLAGAIESGGDQEGRARHLTERMALALQAALLVRHAPNEVADAFCASRLGSESGLAYGTLLPGAADELLIERCLPRRS